MQNARTTDYHPASMGMLATNLNHRVMPFVTLIEAGGAYVVRKKKKKKKVGPE